MKQEQSKRLNSQQQAGHKINKSSPVENKAAQPEKPAVTDDAGNMVNKKSKDAGKGYSEAKPTEAWSSVTISGEKGATKAPAEQEKETEKVYASAEDKKKASDADGHRTIPEQENPEEPEIYKSRIRQSKNVAG